MKATEFDEGRFFAAIAASDCRALLIGRRALIALGLPVVTSDYDFWIHIDDAAAFNAAVAEFGLVPTCAPEQARAQGRYTLENDEHVDVLVARAVGTIDGHLVAFEDVWVRRVALEVAPGITCAVPSLDDLISTKRFGARPRDADDIRMLERLRRSRP